jgi:hypothetical protein
MAGPGDEVAAGTGGHGPMRVSHADREQVFIPLLAVPLAGSCCSAHGSTSVPVGSPRRACRPAQAVKRPSAQHRPTRPSSAHRWIAVLRDTTEAAPGPAGRRLAGYASMASPRVPVRGRLVPGSATTLVNRVTAG